MNRAWVSVLLLLCGVLSSALYAQSLDIQLPDLHGTEVAKQLRQTPAYQTTPILAFTAHALADEVASFKAAGMNDVIFKPLEVSKLQQIMRWCVSGKTDNPAK